MTTKMPDIKKNQGNVVDVGGVFIYAHNPKSLAEWYRKKMGIGMAYNPGEENYHFEFCHGKDAPGAFSVFAIIPAREAPTGKKNQFMINFRIDDFDGFIAEIIRTIGLSSR